MLRARRKPHPNESSSYTGYPDEEGGGGGGGGGGLYVPSGSASFGAAAASASSRGHVGNGVFNVPRMSSPKLRRRPLSQKEGNESKPWWKSSWACYGVLSLVTFAAYRNVSMRLELTDVICKANPSGTECRKHNQVMSILQTLIDTSTASKSKFKNRARTEEDELARRVKREEALKGLITGLQGKIAKESRREVNEKFGPGPHLVEMTLNDRDKIVVEMASLDFMPHAVHLFLEQVDGGFWSCVPPASNVDNGNFSTLPAISCPHFSANPTHIIQVSVLPGPALNRFKDAQLDTLSFQEYSADFTHEKFTIGFAGRPLGGPDFYINKINNTIDHGPGGQTHQLLEEHADPCFAKVVEGTQILEQIWAPKNNVGGLWKGRLAKPVKITGARVLTKKPKPKQNQEEENAEERVSVDKKVEEKKVEERVEQQVEERVEQQVEEKVEKMEKKSEPVAKTQQTSDTSTGTASLDASAKTDAGQDTASSDGSDAVAREDRGGDNTQQRKKRARARRSDDGGRSVTGGDTQKEPDEQRKQEKHVNEEQQKLEQQSRTSSTDTANSPEMYLNLDNMLT